MEGTSRSVRCEIVENAKGNQGTGCQSNIGPAFAGKSISKAIDQVVRKDSGVTGGQGSAGIGDGISWWSAEKLLRLCCAVHLIVPPQKEPVGSAAVQIVV